MLLQVHLFSFTQKLLQHSTISAITSNPHYPSPRTTTCLAYERSVGFASLQNSGRSISGILARPLPKVSFCCLSLAQPTIEGSFAPNLSACTITSADDPSVTVTKNSVLQQSIVNLIYKATLKMLYRTVPAPFTQGSCV